MIITELEDTVHLMQSSDYKERFIAEYYQTKIRYEKLKRFNDKIELEEVYAIGEVNHDCPYKMLRDQQRLMGEYLHILEMRALIEGVDLSADLVRKKEEIGE